MKVHKTPCGSFRLGDFDFGGDYTPLFLRGTNYFTTCSSRLVYLAYVIFISVYAIHNLSQFGTVLYEENLTVDKLSIA